MRHTVNAVMNVVSPMDKSNMHLLTTNQNACLIGACNDWMLHHDRLDAFPSSSLLSLFFSPTQVNPPSGPSFRYLSRLDSAHLSDGVTVQR